MYLYRVQSSLSVLKDRLEWERVAQLLHVWDL